MFLFSIGNTNQPIWWDQQMTPTKATLAAEHKNVSEIKDLNPFKYKVILVLIFLLIHFINPTQL